jgi:hypothetical protein
MIRLILISFCFLVLTNSCKIYSLSGASISKEVKTATVPYFQNRAQQVQPMLSRNLTEKLKDKIQSQTTLKLVNESGDALFEGVITNYSTQPMAIQGDNTAAKNRLSITVSVKYTNAKDSQYEYETSFTRFEDYDSNKTLDSVENDLIDKIADQLVEDIFNRAFVNW